MGTKCFGAKTDGLHENAVFCLFLTQIVSGNFYFSQFMMTNLKNVFNRFLGLFPFCVFFFFCFFSFSNMTKTPTKSNFLFRNLILTSRQFCKNTILAPIDTVRVFKHTPKHSKNGENSEILDQFLTQLLDKNPQILYQFVTLQHYATHTNNKTT